MSLRLISRCGLSIPDHLSRSGHRYLLARRTNDQTRKWQDSSSSQYFDSHMSQSSRAFIATFPRSVPTMKPSNDGSQPPPYVMPPESARHGCTIMSFPSIASAVDEKHLTALQSEVMKIAGAIARYEPVVIYTRPENVKQAERLADTGISVTTGPVNELWVRDSGPVFTHSQSTSQRSAIGFNFNYWGGKLPLKGDEAVAEHIANHQKAEFHRSRLIMEGGAIEHDGEGTFLGAESCILNDNRNPSVSKTEVEAELRALLGVQGFIWVPGVKGYDITDCHIDALARFVKPGVVLLSKPAPNGPPPMIEAYETAREAISKSRDAKNRSPIIYECEEPDVELLGDSGDHDNVVIASYVNYYLVNGAVIVPKFGQTKPDEAAFTLFEKLFPDREVVQVSINMLARTGGGIHCATQQVPA